MKAEVEQALSKVIAAETNALEIRKEQLQLASTIDSLTLKIKELQADLEIARIDREKLTIRAPFAGIVVTLVPRFKTRALTMRYQAKNPGGAATG